ncbi:MAG: 16S rRNA (guanine(527)-N(7))-methyltransferase RsmG [Bacteroidales bacterium]|nr:16S rRNA (guanine(527)-N(7))-methyltransferase RsmG [Bacteroidales bacterium]
MQLITKYFPRLSKKQQEQFAGLGELYNYWNSKINVISRKDIDQLYMHHILHSLSIAKVLDFKPGTHIMDAGTGGGFPGIPLAILFPETHFLLADSIAKKIKVADNIIRETGLANCMTRCTRVEAIGLEFDFIVSRAVTGIPQLICWIRDMILKESFNSMHNGILCLKGGSIEEELKDIEYNHEIFNISSFFSEDYFETKKVVYIDLSPDNR